MPFAESWIATTRLVQASLYVEARKNTGVMFAAGLLGDIRCLTSRGV
jgi:hypothetical protein